MPKPKPDHREQVEFKLGVKERQFLEDLGLRQTIGAAGQTASNLGSGLSSIISPFISGGDAGLVMALIASHVIDTRLDDTTDEQLLNFLDSLTLFRADSVGVYPSPIALTLPTLGEVRGWPVIICDPADFPGMPARFVSDGSDIPRNHGLGRGDAPSMFGVVWTQTMKEAWFRKQFHSSVRDGVRVPGLEFTGTLTEYIAYCLENLLDVIPWLRLVPETSDADYSSTPPTLNEISKRGLNEKYRISDAKNIIDPDDQNLDTSNPKYLIVWNDIISEYQSIWSNLTGYEKMDMYGYCGGGKRTQITSLSDILANINLSIPVVSEALDLISEPTDTISRLPGMVSKAIAAQAAAAGAVPWSLRPYSAWPHLAIPPSSIYKYEVIHAMVESVKVAIPWYLGTKFAIEGAKALGGILPG